MTNFNEMVCDDNIRKANYEIDKLLEMYPDLKNFDEFYMELVSRRIKSQIAFDKNVLDFLKTIDKTIIREDSMNGKTHWYFHINGRIIIVDAEKLNTPTVFVKKYVKTMNILPPDFNKNEWKIFIKLLQPKIIDERGRV